MNFEFCALLARMLETRQAKGRSGKTFEKLAALSSVNNLIILRNLMLVQKPERTLEIGLSFGGSALLICSTHRDLGREPNAQHVAIDPFQLAEWDDAGLLALEESRLEKFLDFRSVKSSTTLPSLLHTGEQFDLIYIDGSHIFEDVFVDAYFSFRLVREGGLVLFDDSTDPHVAKTIKFITANLRERAMELDLSPYREDRGKSWRFRLARIIGRRQLRGFQRMGVIERPWNDAFHPF